MWRVPGPGSQFSGMPLQKHVSDFTADAFFIRKGAFWLNISTKKDTKKDKNINISSLKLDFKNHGTILKKSIHFPEIKILFLMLKVQSCKMKKH